MNLIGAMIADAATVQGGKLYIHGGGWDTIVARHVPIRHPTLALAFLLRAEYPETMSQIPLVIDIVDEQGEKLPARYEGMVNLSRAPGNRPGGFVTVPHAVTFDFLEIPALGSYRFRITSSRRLLAEVPFQVVSPPSRVQD